MRVFVNNVDGFLAGAICADLAKLTHNITGTRKLRDDALIPPMVKRIVPRIEVRKLLKAVSSCDVVIYDLHDADLEELELLLRVFHSSDFAQELVFILVSSVGVWAKTQRELEQVPDPAEAAPDPAAAGESASAEDGTPAGEEPPAAAEGEGEGEAVAAATPAAPPRARPVPLRSEDYTRRVAAPKFQEWRAIETQVLGLKEKGSVVPYVVCSGIPYGNGEDAFLSLFRAAWQSRNTLRVIGDGFNYIPLIHARDLARTVRHVLVERPPLDYHLAVDKGDLTQRQIIQAVANEFAISYPIQSVTVLEAMLAEFADILTMDLRLEPSSVMLTEPPPAPAGEAPAAGGDSSASADDGGDASAAETAEGSKQGSKANSASGDAAEGADEEAAANEEEKASAPFRWWSEHGLAANIGKVAQEFVRWRRLDPVRFCVTGPPGSCPEVLGAQLAERYNIPLLVFDNVLDEVKNQETALGQELKKCMDDVAAALANPKSQGPHFVPAALAAKVIEAAAAETIPRMRGFVLCGYPQTQEEATVLLLEDTEPAEGEEPSKAVRAAFALDSVVLLASSDEQCQTRLQGGERPFVENEFKKKLERWKLENQPEESQLEAFFNEKLAIEPIKVDVDEVEDFSETANQVSAYVEAKRGAVRNFMAPVRPKVEVVEEVVEEGGKEDEEARRREEEAAKKRKEAEERLEHIKREEFLRLEKHSEPLRQYLMSLVVPTLTSGLVEVCHRTPEDPVGYLAEYLSVYSQVARQHGKKPFAKPSMFAAPPPP